MNRFGAQLQHEFKTQLQREFGQAFEIRTSNHYVVVARTGSAKAYVAAFEQIYREFVRVFKGRGIDLAEPEFPLVAIVLPDEAAFQRYCATERTPVRPGPVGCYVLGSNRAAFYERPVETAIDSTLIHEATHQVAFNTGLHADLPAFKMGRRRIGDGF